MITKTTTRITRMATATKDRKPSSGDDSSFSLGRCSPGSFRIICVHGEQVLVKQFESGLAPILGDSGLKNLAIRMGHHTLNVPLLNDGLHNLKKHWTWMYWIQCWLLSHSF